MKTVVVGAGSFGTAMANVLSQNINNKVVLWTPFEKDACEINKIKINEKYFPNRFLNNRLEISSETNELSSADIVLLTIPSGAVESFFDSYGKEIGEKALIVNLAKGIFRDGKTIIDLIEEKVPNEVVSLKGPTFAAEVMNNLPTMFTLGFKKNAHYKMVNRIFQNTNIFMDYSTDVRGVEILSAIKNIYAIVMGITDARYNSANTRFMILTKAFNEIKIILEAVGGKKDTMFLSCGFGDLGLTALNDLSRNRTLGLLIEKGFYNPGINQNSIVLEGINAISVMYSLLSESQRNYTPLLCEIWNYFENKTDNRFELNFRKLIDVKMKTVLTYGTFDLLHYGHVEILRRARELGDRLIVGLSTDEFNQVKGKESVFNYQKRKEMLEAIEYVDLVIPEEDWEQKIKDVKEHEVDVFVMGDDWEGKFDFLSEYCEVIYLPRTKSISTTKLKTLL